MWELLYPKLSIKKVLVEYTNKNMIYIIRAENSDIVKIGFTHSNATLKKRLATLRGSCPLKLKIEATMNGSKLKERCLHSFYISHHRNGEWFNLTIEEVVLLVEKYKSWSPTENGITRMPMINHQVRKNRKNRKHQHSI